MWRRIEPALGGKLHNVRLYETPDLYVDYAGGPMIRVTRRYRFAASHRLHSDQFSEEQNREVFGKCNNPYGHGHNYEIYVTARGPVDAAKRAGVSIRVRWKAGGAGQCSLPFT